MDSDLGFLLIFIILPTALIVSGIWFLVLIRKDARIRDLSQASTQPNLASDNDAETIDRPAVDPAEPVVIATLPTAALREPQDDEVPPDEEVDETDDDGEEFWTTLPDTQSLPDPAAARESVPVEPDPGSQAISRYTEEITPVVPEPPPSVDDKDPISVESAQSDSERPESDQAEASDDWEVDLDEDGSNEPPERKRRQPDARLVPSSENVKKRTSAGPRRVPPIPRSTSRDEDSVESPDSGRDV